MPQWGLTKDLRQARPWDIPEKWLKPGKVITDPIHGDVYVNRLEQAIIDSSPFQRLRRIRQLGMVHLVYPGATHTRFAHVLGALRVVQDLLDIILGQRDGRHARRDLFAQWEDQHKDQPRSSADKDRDIDAFKWRVAEMIVLARLGTLLHDISHVAYGHSIEDELHILEAHDANASRFEEFWGSLGDGDHTTHDDVQRILNGGGLREALRPLILDKERDPETGERLPPPEERLREMGKYPFVSDLVSNTICADLLDYLPRDHAFTGLPAALGQRFMTAFYVVPEAEGDEEAHFPERMALRIARDGRERKDIVSELLKHLRFRYELQERVIVHHAKLAADAMLGKALELWHDSVWLGIVAREGGSEVRQALLEEPVGVEAVADAYAEDRGAPALERANRLAAAVIETELRRVGDDGLLEYLAGTREPGQGEDGRPPAGAAVRQLADDLLNRHLYKRAAQASGASARQRIYDLFGDREARRQVERAAARYAKVPEEHVVIWLPDPEMRLKIAEVLVDFGTGIAPFNEYSGLGQDIYDAHRGLWTVTAFVHRSVRRAGKEPVVLARLAELMGIEWDRHKPRGAERPADWPMRLAASRALGDQAFDEELDELLEEATGVVHRGEEPLFSETLSEMERLAPRVRSRVRSRRRRRTTE
jgi:HD superfamily phosphohydrolase